MAHGGEALGTAADGKVVFVAGALPGERVRARLTTVKKRWARAELDTVIEPSSQRVEPACPAAARGAGCCDYSHAAPHAQAGFKREVLLGQLGALARRSGVLDGFDADAGTGQRALEPALGWRTRVRLGVDGNGRAGVRKARSNDLVTEVACAQVAPGLLEGIVGEGARRFTPGAEVVAAVDAEGQRHVVETTKAQRGRRVERIDTVVEGSGVVTERAAGREFRFPATAFWQAHAAAPEAYAGVVETWGAGDYERRVGWDLYGGVGLFVPVIAGAIGGGHVDTVDYSPTAAQPQPGLRGVEVTRHARRVDQALPELPAPGLVVLDPPRAGAGEQVVAGIAAAAPERVIHVGCDPATLSRDLAAWGHHGYRVARMELIDAFPGTHHFETVACLEPASQPNRG
ncbi:TRAM domain-containing protein [Corynebacterium timonense]